MSGVLAVVMVAALSAPGPAKAKVDFKGLVAKLAQRETSQEALASLVAEKQAAVPWLTGAAVESSDLTTRGWAIVGLSQVGGDGPQKTLVKLSEDMKQPPLVRTWAWSGRVRLAKSVDELVVIANQLGSYPALQRPLSMRVTELLSNTDASAESLLTMSASNYQLQQMMVEPILALGEAKLVKAMLTAKDMRARQTAAAYLGTLAQRQGKAGNEIVGLAVVKALAFKPGAKDVPWAGGPLYVPNIGWEKQAATELVGDFVAWWVWCDVQGRPEDITKISHSLNSWGLATPVGFQPEFSPQPTQHWIDQWRKLKGDAAVKELLKQTGGTKKFGGK